MSDESRRVLDLLAQGKITVDEADQLLRALASQSTPSAESAQGASEAAPKKPRFIRIAVHKPARGKDAPEDVTIRVPLPMIKGGMRLGALLPGFMGEKLTARMREKGLDLDFSKLDPAALEAIFGEMNDGAIDVESGEKRVRISYE
jgi:hypothetical protein